ncbi:hypothetical protein [Rhodococcus sp. IEGM 1379]|uniref:hypothetical protein n=1 Tax=Rhodococcus sp. IEGM 1379 TaxID=3047086 RepID=UPI0024B6B479|nr:hypothetical protein [Rhodococcus sp. IEGM 1379]MDI9917362.1 hypothetical protein [Rhodococcus sp. IEGM 1379]
MADVLGDRKVVDVLDRAVWGINPVLDLAYSDPLGIKRRTFEPTDPERGAAEVVLDAVAWVLDVIKFPGTAAWSVMSDDQRSQWWTTRLGALNTLVVAFPGIFGVLLSRLPIQDLLAFANQAVVLVAVAREHGVTERDQQVDLLASVLCRREVESRSVLSGENLSEQPVTSVDETWRPFALIGTLWRTAKTFRAISDELHKRPQRAKPYELAGKIPVIGVVADYLGERGALIRASSAGEKWIAIRTKNATTVG